MEIQYGQYYQKLPHELSTKEHKIMHPKNDPQISQMMNFLYNGILY